MGVSMNEVAGSRGYAAVAEQFDALSESVDFEALHRCILPLLPSGARVRLWVSSRASGAASGPETLEDDGEFSLDSPTCKKRARFLPGRAGPDLLRAVTLVFVLCGLAFSAVIRDGCREPAERPVSWSGSRTGTPRG